MVANNTHKLNRWVLSGFSLIILANIVLILALYQARVARIAALPDVVPFLTPNFAIIIGGAITLVLVSMGLVISKRLLMVARPALLWGWIVLSIFGLFMVSSLLDSFTFYAAAFLYWVLLVDVALLLITYHGGLARLSWTAIGRGALGIGFGVLMTFILLEVLLRVYFSMLGTPSQKVAYVYSIAEILAVSNRYEGQPYTNYGLSAAHPEHNARGYRGAALTTPKPDDTYRLFTLGGSTTYGEGITPDEAYPARLQQILHDDYGYSHIEVINAGVNAYSSFDSLANLTYHILDDAPDMVLVYHGVNDVRARLVEPQSYTGQNLQRGYWNPIALQDSLNPSVVVRFTTITLGLVESPTQFETILGADGGIPRCGFFETVCAQVDNQDASAILAANPPIYFERNLRNMTAIATANDVDMVFSTWHYFADETELPNPMMLEHMQAAVDEQNDMIRDLGTQLAVPVVDFAIDDTVEARRYWIDGMHLTADGTREQAAYYATYLIENDLLPPPPSSEN